MKFEVVGRDGSVKMSTEHESCIPDRETLLQMQTAGYTFKMNGKDWKPATRRRKAAK